MVASLPAAAVEPEVRPIGDGGGVGVFVENRSVHPLTVDLGAGAAGGLQRTIEGYGRGHFFAQCVADLHAAPPVIALRAEGQAAPIEVPPLRFPDGLPSLWIASAGAGRAGLEALLKTIDPSARLAHLTPDEVPDTFAALRFAPLLLVSAADLTALTPARRTALRDAVIAGSTLVVAAGEAGGEADVLHPFAAVDLGPVGRSPDAVTQHLEGISTWRPLQAGPGVASRVVAGGAPVLLEAGLGLGRVRVLAVRFADLQPGEVAREALLPP
ncbi:MAG: hypothetical protein KC620_14965, partial [Myxococcales bacterium]|nr:hypothetical protein [Myxococcales bacterium]